MRFASRAVTHLVLSTLATAAAAQDFPQGSSTPDAAELKQLISGKVFSVKTSTSTWRLQINDNGYFYINVGNFADSGTWTAEDGKWCTKPQKSNASCNEMRTSGGSIFMRRDNGEIVQLSPR